jgi:hypothetical protein
VYSYNFPDDRRLLKTLGRRLETRLLFRTTHENTVYFVFFLETVQTALTGADVYYMFVFVGELGDFVQVISGIKESRFTAIDVPIMDAFISLIVQVFFCYRIWTLSKRLWWICIILVIVSSNTFRLLKLLRWMTFLNSFLFLKQLGR